MGEGGGSGNNAAIAAANQGYRVKGYMYYSSSANEGDPSPVVLYATIGYLIVAVLAIWPIGK